LRNLTEMRMAHVSTMYERSNVPSVSSGKCTYDFPFRTVATVTRVKLCWGKPRHMIPVPDNAELEVQKVTKNGKKV
jgi:hypothetical protein